MLFLTSLNLPVSPLLRLQNALLSISLFALEAFVSDAERAKVVRLAEAVRRCLRAAAPFRSHPPADFLRGLRNGTADLTDVV